jgi:hypothetical protein
MPPTRPGQGFGDKGVPSESLSRYLHPRPRPGVFVWRGWEWEVDGLLVSVVSGKQTRTRSITVSRCLAPLVAFASFVVGGCSQAPQPQSAFGNAIYEIMRRHEASPGTFDISDEICGTFDEEDLAVAVEEMPELDTFTSSGDWPPGPPKGTTSARFSRSVGWPRIQTLFIEVQSNDGFCRVQIGTRTK